jgi:UDP:flavonoid glycosyltransferase YjiC (YdhE family)
VRALFASTLGAGHVRPLLPLATALRRRGDDVEFVVPPGAEWQVEGRGFEVTAGASPPAAQMDRLWERFAAATGSEARRIAEREAFAERCTAAMLPPLTAAMGRRRPDVVLREPCEYASGVTAVKEGIPLATVAISFSDAEWSVLDFVADILDRHGEGMRHALGAAPFLTRFPAALDTSPFPCTVRYREPAAEAAPGPTATEDPWPQGPGPRLYVTLGSRTGSMPGAVEAFGTILAAVAPIRAQVLVTLGRDVDPGALAPAPGNVTIVAWVDQEQVLARCDAVICHGGSGTTYGALAHGVPVGFVPMFADQPANARAVTRAGAGLVPDGLPDAADGIPVIGSALVPAIRSMAEALLFDPSYRLAAQSVAREMAGQPDVNALAAMVAAWATGSAMAGFVDA